MSRRVFILEPTKFDLNGADRFGELSYLYRADEPRPSVWSNAFVDECFSRLESAGYSSERDFLLACGSQVPNLLLVSNLVATYDTVNLLLFDSNLDEYVHKQII